MIKLEEGLRVRLRGASHRQVGKLESVEEPLAGGVIAVNVAFDDMPGKAVLYLASELEPEDAPCGCGFCRIRRGEP
jgi:hypothetical protein